MARCCHWLVVGDPAIFDVGDDVVMGVSDKGSALHLHAILEEYEVLHVVIPLDKQVGILHYVQLFLSGALASPVWYPSWRNFIVIYVQGLYVAALGKDCWSYGHDGCNWTWIISYRRRKG